MVIFLVYTWPKCNSLIAIYCKNGAYIRYYCLKKNVYVCYIYCIYLYLSSILSFFNVKYHLKNKLQYSNYINCIMEMFFIHVLHITVCIPVYYK